ncbi:hypothetical protein ACFCP7_26550 [Paenibacillus elgii]
MLKKLLALVLSASFLTFAMTPNTSSAYAVNGDLSENRIEQRAIPIIIWIIGGIITAGTTAYLVKTINANSKDLADKAVEQCKESGGVSEVESSGFPPIQYKVTCKIPQ